MKKIILTITFLVLIVISFIIVIRSSTYNPPKTKDILEKYSDKDHSKTDHSQFAILNKELKNPQNVTEACITCHTERHKEVMNSSHWNWERPEYIEGKGIVYLGKKNAVNNFCIGTQTNEEACAKCHIGYGMNESGFAFTDPENIDCMICHDNSGTYVKGNNLGGYPDPALNLNEIAQHIGRPTRDNCGVCHFFGGGGNNVKHGDLDMAMFQPNRELDVHMAVEGADLVCVDCHTTENHQISGKIYSLASMNMNRSSCEQCHTDRPHENEIINEHTLKVACQTCHIPTYAKANSTKMYWDWSTAGKLKDGKPYSEEDSLGNHTYLSIKGSFEWGNDLEPDYIWFNGTADHYLLGDKIKDTTQALVLNQLYGSYEDRTAKIIPVKIHMAKQIYDPINMYLIQPHLYSSHEGEGAFWKDFDWDKANKIGMEKIGLPYSGKYSFIETMMYWPVNHQVSPKEESLQCTDCHTRENSRLADLTDFYMPGRDYNSLVDSLGKLLILFSFIGILIHSSVRIFIRMKKAGK
ncbi:MAG: tetrathionate reductase family octaheme c-type cytochrome [Melioribacteraceae bacterium]|nr:tetrathionate reductase family octaheme c-type cytochrome [Melioribacteraceae bacterium]